MGDKVTALIPTYQRPKLLRRAILSVLNQTHKNLQVSVFDNASGDNTEDVVAALKNQDTRILYHRHKKNMGALQNFKYAFRSVNTAYFSVLSDDDVLVSDFYEQATHILENNTDIGFVILNTLSIDENANLIGNQLTTHALRFYRGDARFDIASIDKVPHTWTAMVFRKELAEIYINMQDQYDVAADMRFLTIARAKYNFAHLSKIGAFFTCHIDSASVQRPYFDLPHHAVQISRYIEIYYDKTLPEIANDQAYLNIKKMLSRNRRQSFNMFYDVIKQAIKNICSEKELNDNVVDNEIQNARRAGFHVIALCLHLIYKNSIVNHFIYFCVARYYKKYVFQQKTAMMVLQNGSYKELFEKLKALSA